MGSGGESSQEERRVVYKGSVDTPPVLFAHAPLMIDLEHHDDLHSNEKLSKVKPKLCQPFSVTRLPSFQSLFVVHVRAADGAQRDEEEQRTEPRRAVRAKLAPCVRTHEVFAI